MVLLGWGKVLMNLYWIMFFGGKGLCDVCGYYGCWLLMCNWFDIDVMLLMCCVIVMVRFIWVVLVIEFVSVMLLLCMCMRMCVVFRFFVWVSVVLMWCFSLWLVVLCCVGGMLVDVDVGVCVDFCVIVVDDDGIVVFVVLGCVWVMRV